MDKKRIEEYIELALEAAFIAGKKIMQVYSKPINVEIKNDGSPLTEADQASQAVIISFLNKTGLPVLSEEGKDVPYSERQNWSLYWLVDPLDGTKEFIKRNGEFTVNIALMENNIPCAGIVTQPVKGILYAGIAGDGLYKFNESDTLKLNDDKKVIDLKIQDRGTTRVVASRSHMSDETEMFIEELKREGKNIKLINAGSSLKFCIIAEGAADVYPRFAPTMEWDTAAGHALLKAVGKNIYLYPSGTEMPYNKPQLINDWFIAR